MDYKRSKELKEKLAEEKVSKVFCIEDFVFEHTVASCFVALSTIIICLIAMCIIMNKELSTMRIIIGLVCYFATGISYMLIIVLACNSLGESINNK